MAANRLKYNARLREKTRRAVETITIVVARKARAYRALPQPQIRGFTEATKLPPDGYLDLNALTSIAAADVGIAKAWKTERE
jgi:hypothetical protein